MTVCNYVRGRDALEDIAVDGVSARVDVPERTRRLDRRHPGRGHRCVAIGPSTPGRHSARTGRVALVARTGNRAVSQGFPDQWNENVPPLSECRASGPFAHRINHSGGLCRSCYPALSAFHGSGPEEHRYSHRR